VAPLQTLEVGKLRKKITDFESKQNEFRRDFTRMRFFRFKCRRPYEYLAQANRMIIHMEDEMLHLQVLLNFLLLDFVRIGNGKLCKVVYINNL
jgi:hypothetical protein